MRQFSSTAILCLTTALLCGHGAVAGTVRLETAAGGRISVIADDASLDEVLATLSKAYAFKVDRVGYRLDSEPLTGQYDGSVRAVLTRLLQDENHIIQNSARAKAGIASISIYSTGRPQNSGANEARPVPTQLAPRPIALVPAPVPIPKAVPRKQAVGTPVPQQIPPIYGGPRSPVAAPVEAPVVGRVGRR